MRLGVIDFSANIGTLFEPLYILTYEACHPFKHLENNEAITAHS